MRHRRAHRKLGRTSSHRMAMLRNMVTDFLDHERMVTTVAKAKELRPFAEKIITLGKRESLHARRQALSVIRRKEVVHKLFEDLAPRFADRAGGYTRIIRLGARKGDAAELAVIELVGAEVEVKETKKGKKAKEEPKAKGKPEPKAKAPAKPKAKAARKAKAEEPGTAEEEETPPAAAKPTKPARKAKPKAKAKAEEPAAEGPGENPRE